MHGYIGGHYAGITVDTLVKILQANGNLVVCNGSRIELTNGVVIEVGAKRGDDIKEGKEK